MGVQVNVDPAALSAALKEAVRLVNSARRASRAGQVVHGWNTIQRTAAFLKAFQFSNSQLLSPSTRMGRAGVVALVGYSMVLYGYLMDVFAEFDDPYAPNEGLTGAL
jgi:hypothetical protein